MQITNYKIPGSRASSIALAICASLLAFASTSRATIIQYGLYDTGVDNSGISLGNNSVDPHYSLDNGIGLVVSPPHSAWLNEAPANGASRWVGTLNSESIDNDHIYVTTFNLPAIPGAISFSGSAASDNDSVIYLNGVQIGAVPWVDAGGNSFTHYTAFSTVDASLFKSGENILSIVVHNGYPNGQGAGGPYGLRLNDLSITGFAPVPEPTTLIAGGLLLLPFGISTLRRIRKNRTA